MFYNLFRVLLLYNKSHYSQRIFISDLIDRSVQLISQQQGCAKQTDVTNAKLEFAGDARFQIFTQKWLAANIKYFISFKLKSFKSADLRQNITTLPKH